MVKFPQIPSAISRRFALYSILIAVLLTSGLFLMPQVFASVLANYFTIAPIEDAVFVAHPVLCQENQERIKNLSVNKKVALAEFIAATLQAGPEQIKSKIESNGLINTLSELLNQDAYETISKHANNGNCLFETLKTLGPSSLPALPALLDAATNVQYEPSHHLIQQTIPQILNDSPAAAGLLKDKIISMGDEISQVQNAQLWKIYLYTKGPTIVKDILEIFDKSPAENKNYPMALNSLSNFIWSGPTPPEIVAYVSDRTKNADRRLALLERIRSGGRVGALEGRILISLMNEEDRRFYNLLHPVYQTFTFKTQDDLNAYIEMNQAVFSNFELKTRADWVRIDEVVRYLQLLNQKVGQAGLRFSELTPSLVLVLEKVAEQLGYRTESYRKIANAVFASPAANEMQPYLVKLLRNKKEQNIALEYLLRMETLNEKTQAEIATHIVDAKESELIESLNLLMRGSRRSGVLVLEPPLLKVVTGLLASKNENLALAAYNTLKAQGEPVTLFVREEIKTATGIVKLDLLRINWHYSSTEAALTLLLNELKSRDNCDSHFANGFVETLPKASDSPSRLKSSQQGISLREMHFMEASPIFVVKVPPMPALFAAYLQCDLKFLRKNVVATIAKINSELRTILENEIAYSTGPKKAFLTGAIADAGNPPEEAGEE